MKALSIVADPNCASIPFDARRSGFVMDCAVENARAFLAGSPVNVVNP